MVAHGVTAACPLTLSSAIGYSHCIPMVIARESVNASLPGEILYNQHMNAHWHSTLEF